MVNEPIDDSALEEMEFLESGTCWSLLRSTELGRLAVPTPYGGVDIFPVNHLVDQGSLVFRTAHGSKLTHAVQAHEVAFEIDGQDEATAWSVVAHGRAELIDSDTAIFDCFELDVRPWHLSHKPYFVRITPTSVTGRRFRIDPSSRSGGPDVSADSAADTGSDTASDKESPWSST